MDFIIGDVVALKGGGPGMTVEQNILGRVYCVWFENATLYRSTFAVDSVKFVSR
jgi:uncharacterized protein YodC (DUF2158 family)